MLRLIFSVFYFSLLITAASGRPAESSKPAERRPNERPIPTRHIVGVRLQDNPVYSGMIIAEMSATKLARSGDPISFEYMIDVIDPTEVHANNNTFSFEWVNYEQVQVPQKSHGSASPISIHDCAVAERIGSDPKGSRLGRGFAKLGEPVRNFRPSADNTLPLPDRPEITPILYTTKKEMEQAFSMDASEFQGLQKFTKALRLTLDLDPRVARSVLCFPLESWQSVEFGFLTKVVPNGSDVHEKLAKLLRVHPLQITVTEDDCCNGVRIYEKLVNDGYSGVWLYNVSLRGNASEIARANAAMTDWDISEVLESDSNFPEDSDFPFATRMAKYLLSKHQGSLIIDPTEEYLPAQTDEKPRPKFISRFTSTITKKSGRIMGVRLNDNPSFNGMIISEMKEEPEKYSGDLIPGSFEYAVNVIDDRLVVNNTYPDVFWNIASVEKKMSEQDDQISLSDCLLGERILHDKDRKHLHKFQQLGKTIRDRHPRTQYFLPLSETYNPTYYKHYEKANAAAALKADRERGVLHMNTLKLSVLGPGSAWNREKQLKAVGCFRLEEWTSVSFLYLTTLAQCKIGNDSGKTKVCQVSDIHHQLARQLNVHPLQVVVKEDEEAGSQLFEHLSEDGYSGVWLYNVTIRGDTDEIDRLTSEMTFVNAHLSHSTHNLEPFNAQNQDRTAKFSFVPHLVKYLLSTKRSDEFLFTNDSLPEVGDRSADK
ncbi:hypothetical protein DdX_15434 [Ditylenchus destructor]|uniref:Uncharacterized protein n=1 Tax=Ditylenchus destructor TaxID=166010 RepID=A0AAD4MRG3_9BILA|nr:hypothetical protein DdX_15434 [Ditylenchus destructor]